MSEHDDLKAKLSAFVDDELDAPEERRVLAALEKDAGLRRAWERYHLMRSALRQDLGVLVSPEVAERVAARIQAEPVAKVIPLRRQKIMRLAGTLAIAASVAAVAITGLQWLNQPASAPLAQLAAGQPASDSIIRAGSTRWNMKEPEAESALNAFLVEHNEFASSSGIGGMMPYVRVVGYDNSVK